MTDDAPDPSAEEPVDAVPGAEPAPRRYGAPLTEHRGQISLHPTRDSYVTTVTAMRSDGFWQCLDVCAVDYLTYGAPRPLPVDVAAERFEVVSSFINHTTGERLRVRVQVPESDPTCPSLFDLFPGTGAPEREAFDLFGVVFDGHPHLTRILLPDDWEGHPLRKDSALGNIPVQFKAGSTAR